MRRTLIGACVGAVCGVLALAAAGAVAGYTQGGEAAARISVPPGPYAAVLAACVWTAYFWWLAGPVGAIIGGTAALGSWLVRPRRPADSGGARHAHARSE
jgi:hypothetical protein